MHTRRVQRTRTTPGPPPLDPFRAHLDPVPTPFTPIPIKADITNFLLQTSGGIEWPVPLIRGT